MASARENLPVGSIIDFISFCISNDGETGIEPTETTPGVLDVSYEIIRLRAGESMRYNAAEAAMVASKPPTATAGQVNNVLLPDDLDEELEDNDDLYVKTVYQTTEGPKTFLIVFDVTVAGAGIVLAVVAPEDLDINTGDAAASPQQGDFVTRALVVSVTENGVPVEVNRLSVPSALNFAGTILLPDGTAIPLDQVPFAATINFIADGVAVSEPSEFGLRVGLGVSPDGVLVGRIVPGALLVMRFGLRIDGIEVARQITLPYTADIRRAPFILG